MDGEVITLFEIIVWPAFVLTLLLAIGTAIRHPTRNHWLVAAVIAAPAMGWIAYALAAITGTVGRFIHFILLLPLVHPLLLFFLATTFRRLPRNSRLLATASYVAIALFTLLAGPGISLIERMIIFTYMVSAEVTITVLFLISARGHAGITRRRLQIIGLANIATIAATTFSAVTIGRPPLIFAQLTALVTFLSMLGHLIGFAPPLWLRRIWQRYELETFLREATQIPPGQEVGTILDLLESIARRAIAPRAIALLRHDRDGETFHLLRPEAYAQCAPVRFDRPPLSTVVQERKARVISLPADLGQPLQEIGTDSQSVTAMVVPIATDTRLWGLFIAFTGYQPLFANDELPQLRILIRQCALLLDYDETLAQEQTNRRRAEALARVARALEEPESSGGTAHEDPLTIFCTETARVLNVPVVALRQYDPAAGQMRLTHHVGLPDTLQAEIQRRTMTLGNVSQAERASRVLIFTDIREAEALRRRDPFINSGLRTVVSVGMSREGHLIGDLNIATLHEPRSFTAEELDMLQALAAQAAGALTNIRLLEQLRGYAAELEETVARRTKDLERRNEELDAFAHTVAHDLKDPVSNIMGFGNMLLTEASGLSDEERQYVEIMVRNSRRMERIINELLLLANVRQADVVREPVDMTLPVLEALARLDTLRVKYDAETHYPLSWPTALGYAPWLEEVWVNYISNAINYGGRPPVVTLSAQVLDDGYVRFLVSDNGRGLTPEEQASLFSVETHSLRPDGHGFGLSIVRRIVEKLGGRVGVESTVGEGSTFWFDLPQADS